MFYVSVKKLKRDMLASYQILLKCLYYFLVTKKQNNNKVVNFYSNPIKSDEDLIQPRHLQFHENFSIFTSGVILITGIVTIFRSIYSCNGIYSEYSRS